MKAQRQLEADRHIVQQGVERLEAERAYTQAAIQRKLAYLGYELARSSLNNLVHGRPVSPELARRAREAMVQLVQLELGYGLDAAGQQFDLVAGPPSDWKPERVLEHPSEAVQDAGLVFRREGRLPVQDKVDLIKDAQQEVSELGIRLRTFANYFFSRSAYEFKDHIEGRLAAGVHFKLYLLNPDCNEGRLYFEDRARVQAEEQYALDDARRALEGLVRVQAELSAADYPGNFELYLYKHIPQAHFFIVDGGLRSGRMAVSPYLYGVKRADCPVILLDKAGDRRLFRLYHTSFQQSVKQATLYP